jgi:beta-ketoadipate pathway transcriptional regulators, PcaR/PcaU/PobR family
MFLNKDFSESIYFVKNYVELAVSPLQRNYGEITMGRELPKPGDTYVQSFARGLMVIQAFGPEKPQMTLAEVADATGLTRAGARRILLTLQHLGFVASEGRFFRLTPRILDLGYAYLSTQPLWRLAMPILRDVTEKTGESCSITALDDTDIVYIVRNAAYKIMSVNLAVGSRLPAWASAMGRVLLAGLPEAEMEKVLARSDLRAHTPYTVTEYELVKAAIHQVRVDGYSLVSQELEESLQAIAVPITDRDGKVIAAINISSYPSEGSRKKFLQDYLPVLRAAAEELHHLLCVRAL